MSDVVVMHDGGDGLDPIREVCNGTVSFQKEGERNFILMENLRLLKGGSEVSMDALLCLNHDNPTYPTKLYLAENLGGGLNWNETAYLLARNWYTFSWSGVQPDQPYLEILAGHLAPLSKTQAA